MVSDMVFGKGYADQYDLLYGDKDYEAECDLIEEVFRRYGEKPIKTVLDLGCGTGNHAWILARRGYEVTGVDRSGEMIRQARDKGEGPVFQQGDVRNLDLGVPFDAGLMMFAVLGYQLANEEVLSALRTVRRHLAPGGLFIADVWYGPAVLATLPGERVKVVPTADGKLIRVASGELDTCRHLCEVHYRVWRINGRGGVTETEERHLMRFFFPLEMELLLNLAGFRIEALTGFPDLSTPPDQTTWNALVVARAINV